MTNGWTVITDLNLARSFHRAVLLPSGKVLVCGGIFHAYIPSVDSGPAELYDPRSGTWTPTGSSMPSLILPTATLLQDGTVLFVPPGNEQTQLYNPSIGDWQPTKGKLNVPRSYHTATLLPSGRVLAAAGLGNTEGFLKSAELYDPATQVWTFTTDLIKARYNATATLLMDGRVLVVGGDGSLLNSAELYDPGSDQWASAKNSEYYHLGHTATLLSNGKVLVVGGFRSHFGADLTNEVEIYDPTSGDWHIDSTLNVARQNHAATLLHDGKVLVEGGIPREGSWEYRAG
jgi:hypothetical protein